MADWRGSAAWGPVTTLLGGLMVVLASLSVPLVALFTGRGRALMHVARAWCGGMAAVGGIDFRREGWEDLPEDIRTGRQPVVFMGNHESHLDPPFAIGGLGVPAVFIAKRELKWVPFLGQVIWFVGFIFINRQDRARAMESLAKAARDIRAGRSVVIFPEGTRCHDGRLGDFKKGGFALAQDAGVPIVPMALDGGWECLPRGSHQVRPGAYRMRLGAPVDPAAFPSREALMAEVRGRIQELLERGDADRPAR